MARPKVELTQAQAAQVESLAAYLSKGQIADFFGISRPTFDAILERDELVSLHYKRGKSKAIANVAQGLIKQAINGNTTAAIFYLKTQAGWREVQGIDHTTNGKDIPSGLGHFYGRGNNNDDGGSDT